MRVATLFRTGPGRGLAAALLLVGSAATAGGQAAGIELTVDALGYDRRDTPVQISIPTADLLPDVADRLGQIAEQGAA